MHKHPDADAFIREYLARPADATTRLVFADWLEETGTPANAAWARYIRLSEEADRQAPGTTRRVELLAQIAWSAARVRARLTLPARVLIRRHVSLALLVPLTNVTVRLAGYRVPRAALEHVPRFVAERHNLIPLASHPDALLIAAMGPLSDEIRQRFEHALRSEIVAVRAEPADLRAAIDRYFPPDPDPLTRRHFFRRAFTERN